MHGHQPARTVAVDGAYSSGPQIPVANQRTRSQTRQEHASDDYKVFDNSFDEI